MGRRKGGGLTGVSRFLLESTKTEAESQPIAPEQLVQGSHCSSADALPGPEEDRPSKRREIKGFSTARDPQTQDSQYSTADALPGLEEDRPSKRRKTKGSNTARDPQTQSTEEGGWIEKYSASGLVPHYTDASQVPDYLRKYFSQRNRYFSRYSTPPGCLLDEEGWYSVTPELIANQIAERCRCDTVLDPFCGVGGNAIAFAQTCQRVIALDTSPVRLALARHNAQIYGVADRIEFILSDYISFANAYLSLPSSSLEVAKRKVDVVFLSPPWGGPSYLSGSTTPAACSPTKNPPEPSSCAESHPSFSLSSIQPIHGAALFRLSRRITRNIAFYLPRNTVLEEINDLLESELSSTPQEQVDTIGVDEMVEVEEEWMGKKLKALTCYFGGLVGGQDHLFDH